MSDSKEQGQGKLFAPVSFDDAFDDAVRELDRRKAAERRHRLKLLLVTYGGLCLIALPFLLLALFAVFVWIYEVAP